MAERSLGWIGLSRGRIRFGLSATVALGYVGIVAALYAPAGAAFVEGNLMTVLLLFVGAVCLGLAVCTSGADLRATPGVGWKKRTQGRRVVVARVWWVARSLGWRAPWSGRWWSWIAALGMGVAAAWVLIEWVYPVLAQHFAGPETLRQAQENADRADWLMSKDGPRIFRVRPCCPPPQQRKLRIEPRCWRLPRGFGYR